MNAGLRAIMSAVSRIALRACVDRGPCPLASALLGLRVRTRFGPSGYVERKRRTTRVSCTADELASLMWTKVSRDRLAAGFFPAIQLAIPSASHASLAKLSPLCPVSWSGLYRYRPCRSISTRRRSRPCTAIPAAARHRNLRLRHPRPCAAGLATSETSSRKTFEGRASSFRAAARPPRCGARTRQSSAASLPMRATLPSYAPRRSREARMHALSSASLRASPSEFEPTEACSSTSIVTHERCSRLPRVQPCMGCRPQSHSLEP